MWNKYVYIQVILHDLVKKRQHAPILDPRSASRTPSAKKEPSYKTRYESPIFACKYRHNNLSLSMFN